MSWLDANDYSLLERVARDRVDELRATVDVALTKARTSDDRPRPHGEVERGRPCLWRAMLGAPEVAR
jgi:hypothetical protein